MDLTGFKKLTKDQYEALSERDQVKYELQLEAYNEQKEKETVAAAEKAAREATEKAIEAAKEADKKERDEAIEAAVKVVKDEYDAKIEKAQAEMNRAKIAQNELRGIKTMQDEIMEKLSTEEGEKMMKDFLGGQREKLNVQVEAKAVFKPTGANGSGVAPQFAPIVGPGHDAFHARNVIPVFPTSSDLIKYVRMTVDTSSGGFGMVAEGGQKPNLGYIPTVVDAPVRKIAGLIDVTDEFNDDVVGARAFWAYELPQAYMDAEDLQIFKGNGAGQNLEGLWYQADNQTLPQGSVTTTSNVWDKIAAGITEVRTLKRNTSAVFIDPISYLELLINKDDQSAYTYPIIMGNDNILRIGGVPIMWSNVFEEGEGLVGDFARGTAIFQKQAMNIRYSDENKDNFEKNMVTIRLEGREALPIYYPESFKKLLLASA